MPWSENAASSSRSFEAATGTQVDGVITADPFALEALVQGTGPTHIPTLGLTVGADDVGISEREARDLHERIAGSELVVLEDASHLCNLEQPERFNQAVLAFLEGRDQ